MQSRRFIFLLLLTGLVFSSLIRVVYTLSNGFEYQEMWIKLLPLPIFDFATQDSSQLALTSTIVGYLVYMVAGILMLKKEKEKIHWIIPFLLIIVISIIFEVTSIVQAMKSHFTGQHLRIGPTLFLAGLFILNKDQLTSLQRAKQPTI